MKLASVEDVEAQSLPHVADIIRLPWPMRSGYCTRFFLAGAWLSGRWLQSLDAFDALRREWIEPDSWTGVTVETTRQMCRAP